MTNTVYYYSATGNSLVLARRIAEELGDTELIPFAKFKTEGIRKDSARIGFVFPVYAWGAPRTVTEAITQMDLSAIEYCFAVASCGGTAGGTLPRIRSLLKKKGGNLHAGFIVLSPSYYQAAEKSPQATMISIIHKLSGKTPKTDTERLSEIISTIKDKKSHRPERSALLGSLLGNMLHGVAVDQLAKQDANYATTSACNGCGTCWRICPRNNIAIEQKKPIWKHDCDACGACITWCPNNAIVNGETPATASLHHPQVELQDFIVG